MATRQTSPSYKQTEKRFPAVPEEKKERFNVFVCVCSSHSDEIANRNETAEIVFEH